VKQYDSELLCVKHYVNQSYFVQNCVNRSLNESSMFLTFVVLTELMAIVVFARNFSFASHNMVSNANIISSVRFFIFSPPKF